MNGTATVTAAAAATTPSPAATPPNNLGRDNLWTTDIWSGIDTAVTSDVGQVRVVQRVFPSTLMANASYVPADHYDPATNTIAEGQTKPLIGLSLEFSLAQSQADNEASLHTGQKSARLSAKSVALAEDVIFLRGKHAIAAGNVLPGNVQVTNGESADQGLLFVAPHQIVRDRTAKDYPNSIFEAVVEGIAYLTSQGQPGPYTLLLENGVFADAHRADQIGVTPMDRIQPLVTGGLYNTGALSVPRAEPVANKQPVAAQKQGGTVRFGLLASTGGEPVTIYIAVDTITAFTQTDTTGVLRFRVFERVQYVARDPRALVRLRFDD